MAVSKLVPLVVATVTSAEDLMLLRSGDASLEGIDVLEFRLDNLHAELGGSESVPELRAQLLFTPRSRAEGGTRDYADDAARIAQVEPFLERADYVDLEVASLDASGELQRFAQRLPETETRLIASYHDFVRTPSVDELRERMDMAVERGADLFKAAVYLDEFSRLAELVAFLEEAPIAVSLMGMGPLGKLSRLVFARAGSVLNYGYLQKANAPGQWKATELKRLMDAISHDT